MALQAFRRGVCSKIGGAGGHFPFPVSVLGIPMRRGQKKAGTEFAPEKLREESKLISSVETVIGQRVKDYGDLDFSSCGDYKGNPTMYMAEASRLIRKSVADCLNESRRLVTLGGDHSMAIGTVTGHADYAREHDT